jgi:hypothetical protein
MPRNSEKVYTTTRLPGRSEVIALFRGTFVEWIARVEGGWIEDLCGRVQENDAKDLEFLKRLQFGWRKWVPVYNTYAYACLTEPLLRDYDSTRMLGLMTGFASEGVGLCAYLLGALLEQGSFHKEKAQWQPILTAIADVAERTSEGCDQLLSWTIEWKRKRFDVEVEDIRLKESYQIARATLVSLKSLAEGLQGGDFLDVERMEEALAGRSDVERCALQGEDSTRFLEAQGVVAPTLTGRQGKNKPMDLVSLDEDTVADLNLCQDRINQARRKVGMDPITDRRVIIQEVSRMFLSLGVPYYPSPFREGRGVVPGRKSHLGLDLEKIAQNSGLAIGMLGEYIEKSRVLHPLGVGPLVKAYEASLKVRCHYRYFICPVLLESSPTGRGYKLVVKGPDEAPPREAMSYEQIQQLLIENKPGKDEPRKVGRPIGSGRKDPLRKSQPAKAKAGKAKAGKAAETTQGGTKAVPGDEEPGEVGSPQASGKKAKPKKAVVRVVKRGGSLC